MEIYSLDTMIKGWFIGNFEPTLYSTNAVEVAVKKYTRGDYESMHYHKVATEFTVIVEGVVKMCGNLYKKNDIILIRPGESTDFEVIEDTITVVVKLPGASDDKYVDKI